MNITFTCLCLTKADKVRNHTDSCFAFLTSFQATIQPSYFVAEEPEDDNILRTRTYDISIT